jgi:Mg2+/Co2+ transporter CorB
MEGTQRQSFSALKVAMGSNTAYCTGYLIVLFFYSIVSFFFSSFSTSAQSAERCRKEGHSHSHAGTVVGLLQQKKPTAKIACLLNNL